MMVFRNCGKDFGLVRLRPRALRHEARTKIRLSKEAPGA
jgi:hypothetical protein